MSPIPQASPPQFAGRWTTHANVTSNPKESYMTKVVGRLEPLQNAFKQHQKTIDSLPHSMELEYQHPFIGRDRIVIKFTPSYKSKLKTKKVRKKWCNGVRFWEQEPLEAFIQRAVAKAQQWAKRYDTPVKTPKPQTPTVKPLTAQPATTQPATAKLETAQPAAPQPATAKLETAQPTATQPATAKLETAQPAATQPATAKLETAQPAAPQPATAKLETEPVATPQPVATLPVGAKE